MIDLIGKGVKFYKPVEFAGRWRRKAFDAVIVGAEPSPDSSRPRLNLAYLNRGNEHFLSGSDWRQSFELVPSVPHVSDAAQDAQCYEFPPASSKVAKVAETEALWQGSDGVWRCKEPHVTIGPAAPSAADLDKVAEEEKAKEATKGKPAKNGKPQLIEKPAVQ